MITFINDAGIIVATFIISSILIKLVYRHELKKYGVYFHKKMDAEESRKVLNKTVATSLTIIILIIVGNLFLITEMGTIVLVAIFGPLVLPVLIVSVLMKIQQLR